MVLIKDGIVFCVHLKDLKDGHKRTYRMHSKSAITFDADGNLTQTSYLEHVYAVFEIM
jgi:hypothetical protein